MLPTADRQIRWRLPRMTPDASGDFVYLGPDPIQNSPLDFTPAFATQQQLQKSNGNASKNSGRCYEPAHKLVTNSSPNWGPFRPLSHQLEPEKQDRQRDLAF